VAKWFRKPTRITNYKSRAALQGEVLPISQRSLFF